jgi:hypothetical protein
MTELVLQVIHAVLVVMDQSGEKTQAKEKERRDGVARCAGVLMFDKSGIGHIKRGGGYAWDTARKLKDER